MCLGMDSQTPGRGSIDRARYYQSATASLIDLYQPACLISRKYPNGIVLSEGFANVGWHIHLMQATGWAMIVVFLHVYFAPYRRLQRAVAAADWPESAKQLAQIRKLVGFNLVLGLVTAIVATGGAYLAGYLASLAD